jgi:hypothetical protein
MAETTMSKSTILTDFTTNEKVEITDSNDYLTVYCYVNCDENSPDTIKNTRGVILDKQGNIVMRSFPYTHEYNHLETIPVRNRLQTIPDNIDDFSFYNSQEGSLIRMFFYNDSWYVSTHKKLNAFSSFWSSKTSFGTYFETALEKEKSTNPYFQNLDTTNVSFLDGFKSTLNPSNQYVFLITNSEENRIVCRADIKVFHICTLIDGKCNFEDDIHIPKPEKLSFSSIDEVMKYVETINIDVFQGVIVFKNENPFNHFKILNQKYQALFAVRGNEPSIKFRYLQLRNSSPEQTHQLLQLYPSCDFSEIERVIKGIEVLLYQSYVQRFIKKMYVVLPKEEFVVISELHKLYITHRTPINLNAVSRVLNNSSAVQMNRMTKRFKNELKKDSVVLPAVIENYTYESLFHITFNK